MLSRPTNISKYVLYNKGIISISEYHHPSCKECRQERESIDVNHTSQLEAFIYFSGSGSGLRIPVPDPAFLVFHTPLRAQSQGRRSIYFKTQMDWSFLRLTLQNYLQLQCFPVHISYFLAKLHVFWGYRSREKGNFIRPIVKIFASHISARERRL